MNFSAWAIRRPTPSILLFVILAVLGMVSFNTLPITRFPNIDVPVVSVTVIQPGAAPSELESQVTKEVEDAVAGITGVKNIVSTVTEERSVTAIEFRLEVDTDRALNDVKDAVARIRTDLPGAIEEPIVERIDVEGWSILTYAISAPGMTLEQLSWHADDVVKRALQGVRGVGRVERVGGVQREVLVQLDADRLLALGVTAAEVNRQIRATAVDLAGGRAELGAREQSIRTLSAADTVRGLEQTEIVLPGGRRAKLTDLGEVVDAYGEPRGFARLDGAVPVVGIGIYRAKGASEVTVKRGVEAAMARLDAQNPGVDYTLVDDSVRYTFGNYQSAMITLIEGAILAVIVVFIFLRNLRATIIAAVALPLSIIPTFWAMDLLGFSMNLVSLLAITLVTGILVDDAIVEIENIVRHGRMGKSPYRAAMDAADEIGLAVIAITLTIVAVFAPVSFMGGIPGQYFKQFGLTVAAAVLFSLLVARLITPMMAAYLMKPIPHKEAKDGFIMRRYTGFLRWTIRHKGLTLLAGIGLFALSLWGSGLLPTGFIPPEDASRAVLSVEMAPGATLEDMRRSTDRVARTIKELPEVDRVLVVSGTTPTGQQDLRRASVYVVLTPKAERERHQQAVEDDISARLAAIPDIRSWLVNERGERELSLTIAGRDPEALAKGVAQLEGAMRRMDGLNSVAANAGLARPEIIVEPKLEQAARLGVTTADIAETVRVATIGDVDANLAKFNAGDRLVPIRVRLTEQDRGDLALLRALPVASASGARVPLEAVAEIRFGQGPSSIDRFNRERRVVLGADLAEGMALGTALEAVKALPEAKTLPPGVRIQETGDAEIMADVFAGFAQAMGAGIMLVLAVLVLLFGGIFQPITILLSLPLSIGGVILGLMVTHQPISMPVVIGILMLMGIVTKNAIMLVDFAVEAVERGASRVEAIVDAGRKRARPIIMTTIAMVAGMVPSALGVGDGGEFRAPMAIAVIGGLLVSTVLSLVFVPSFYVLMDQLSNWVGRRFARLVGPNEDREAEHDVASPPGSPVAALPAVTPHPTARPHLDAAE